MNKIQKNVSLKPFCNYRIGGPGCWFLEVGTTEELINGLGEWNSHSDPNRLFILGSGCNVLMNDNGYQGLVVHNVMGFIEELGDGLLRIGSGLRVSELLTYCIDNSLSGLEWAGGLPGTVGGAVFGNAGAFGGEIKDCVVSVESLDLQTFQQKIRSNAECGFYYRESVFKRQKLREYIQAATIRLVPGNKDEIAKSINDKIVYRNERHPMEFPNIGSIFKNVGLQKIPSEVVKRFEDKIKIDPFPLIPAAVFLGEAGLKGTRVGNIEISCKHPNFFVNLGDGKASEVRQLIRLAQDSIKVQFGVVLDPEIIEPGQ